MGVASVGEDSRSSERIPEERVLQKPGTNVPGRGGGGGIFPRNTGEGWGRALVGTLSWCGRGSSRRRRTKKGTSNLHPSYCTLFSFQVFRHVWRSGWVSDYCAKGSIPARTKCLYAPYGCLWMWIVCLFDHDIGFMKGVRQFKIKLQSIQSADFIFIWELSRVNVCTPIYPSAN